MRKQSISILFFATLAIAACSISPEKPVTRQELYRSNIFADFTIKESPESVLATLNRDGEVVIEGKGRFGEEYFIKILATNRGLKIRLYAK